MKSIFTTLFLLAASSAALIAQPTATYTLTFESTWSAATHPIDWPGVIAHYSGIHGGTHNSSGSYWAPGSLASTGVVNVAELGSGTAFRAEVTGSGHSDKELALSGPALPPDMVEHTFLVNENFSYVTLISMIAPSPDWFVGVNALNLHDGANWIPEIIVPLIAWDSGSDDGDTYSHANSPNAPRVAIERLSNIPDGNPLTANDIVGTFTFTLEVPLPVELSTFTSTLNDGHLELNWETTSETNNQGFEILHEDGSGSWDVLGFVDGAGTSIESRSYSYVVDAPIPGIQQFRLRQLDFDGSSSLSEVLTLDIPFEAPLSVSSPYPNPALDSSSLTISSAKSDYLNIELFDSSGRKVRDLFAGPISSGQITKLEIETYALPKGVYFISTTGQSTRLVSKFIKR